jgi:hypothetical protein
MPAAAVVLACAAAAFSGTGVKPVADGRTFEILLSLTMPGPTLEAKLVNRSSSEQTVLRNSDLQPSELILAGPSGRELKPFDERTRRKYDRSVSRGMYVKTPSGGLTPLGKAAFRKLPGGKYELRWGPFLFREIPPGVWKARVRFESTIDYLTEQGHRLTEPGVWKGTIVSEEVDVGLDGVGSVDRQP